VLDAERERGEAGDRVELRADDDPGHQAGSAVMTADELVARLVEEFDAEELVPDDDGKPATAERDQ
jgi:hypothetical protein